MEVEQQEEESYQDDTEPEKHQKIQINFNSDSLLHYRRDIDRVELLEDLWNESGSLFTQALPLSMERDVDRKKSEKERG